MCEKCTPEENARVIREYVATAPTMCETPDAMIALALAMGILPESDSNGEGIAFSRGDNVTLHFTIVDNGHGLLETFN